MLGGNTTTTAIITNGLFCSPVERSGIITTFFSLYVSAAPIEKYGGGSHYPRDAWNKIPDIKNFYKPTSQFEDQWQYKRLEDVDVRKSKYVRLVISFNENQQFEKEFVVKEKYSKIIITVGKVFEASKQAINVQINNVKSVKHTITVKINKLRALISRNT